MSDNDQLVFKFKSIDCESATSKVIIKKSRFICNLIKCTDPIKANEFINKIKKRYYDATHNVPVYRILKITQNNILSNTKNNNLSTLENFEYVIDEFYSDDKEPSKTAGFPILEILKKQNIINIAVVITRYFGGIKLGTGGLIRAYSRVFLEALKNCEIIEYFPEIRIIVKSDYKRIGFLKYYLKKNKIKIKNQNYLNDINLEIIINLKDFDSFIKFLKDNLFDYKIIS